MLRKLLIWGGIFVFLPVLVAMVWQKAPVAKTSAEGPDDRYVDHEYSHCDFAENEKLGDGAFAEWGSPEFSQKPLSEGDPETVIRVHGSTEFDKNINVKVEINIGHLYKTVLNKNYFIPQNEILEIKIPFSNVFDLHPNQERYVTRVHAEMETIPADSEERKFFQSLEPCYLAKNIQQNRSEVLSASEKDARYPFGLLDAQEQQSAQQLAQNRRTEGLALEGVGSGVFYSATLSKEEIAAKRAERMQEDWWE